MKSIAFKITLAVSLLVVIAIVAMTYISGREMTDRFNEYMKEAAEIQDEYPVIRDGNVVTGPVEKHFIRDVYVELAWVGLPIMLLALVVSFIIAKGSTAPIRRLSRAASEISKGNLGHKVEVKAGGELGLLAGSFNSMAAALLQAQSLRKQFFADAAHELKTPIAVIKGNLEAMLDGVVPMERDKIASLFEESAFLNRIVDDIRYLALADSGQLVLHKKEADMQAIVEVCADRVGPALREKEQKLVREGSTDPLMTVIDADRMTQVIYNLLVNAGKYTQNGGTVGIVTERSTDNGAEYFKVTVWDNGNGISAQDVPHVFERFYRADKSRDKKTGGTGLGLAIVKKIVELHGGRVGVKSEPGKGSRFYIEIPVERKRTVGG